MNNCGEDAQETKGWCSHPGYTGKNLLEYLNPGPTPRDSNLISAVGPQQQPEVRTMTEGVVMGTQVRELALEKELVFSPLVCRKGARIDYKCKVIEFEEKIMPISLHLVLKTQ